MARQGKLAAEKGDHAVPSGTARQCRITGTVRWPTSHSYLPFPRAPLDASCPNFIITFFYFIKQSILLHLCCSQVFIIIFSVCVFTSSLLVPFSLFLSIEDNHEPVAGTSTAVFAAAIERILICLPLPFSSMRLVNVYCRLHAQERDSSSDEQLLAKK